VTTLLKPGPRRERLITAAALIVLALAVLRTAWLCDDAFITLRTVDNWVHGFGLRWNVDERAQAYTHPLWMLLMAACYAITREPLYTLELLSSAVALGAVALLLFGRERPAIDRVWIVALLVFSKTFLSYATSGLESPLLFLLLARFLVVYLRAEDPSQRLGELALLAGLALLTRFDALWLFAPPLAAAAWRAGARRAWKPLALGALPVVTWELFAIFYYGWPLPNTAYAKLSTGVPLGRLLREALHYTHNFMMWDCLSLAVILLGAWAPLLERNRRAMAVSAGIALHVAYVMRVGGDFMCGRFFAAPLFAAIATLYLIDTRLSPRLRPLIALPLAGLLSTAPGSHWSWMRGGPAHFHEHGVTDERALYYPLTGLLADRPADGGRFMQLGLGMKARGDKMVIENMIGMIGYYAGPAVHIIDNDALAEPLLSHAPVMQPLLVRIGHYERGVPPGYRETVESGVNQLKNPSLALYYDKLLVVIRGPLFAPGRLGEILRFNLGAYDHLMDNYVHNR